MNGRDWATLIGLAVMGRRMPFLSASPFTQSLRSPSLLRLTPPRRMWAYLGGADNRADCRAAYGARLPGSWQLFNNSFHNLFGWGQTRIARRPGSILNAPPDLGVVVAHLFTATSASRRKLAGVMLGFPALQWMTAPVLIPRGGDTLAQLAASRLRLLCTCRCVGRRFKAMGVSPSPSQAALSAGAADHAAD